MRPWSLSFASSFLRKREEDYISALVLSIGLGLAIAGVVALSLRDDVNIISRLPGVIHMVTLSVTLATAVIYYAAWGTWIRRRLRKPLYSLALLCSVSVCSSAFFGSHMNPAIAGISTAGCLLLVAWFVWKRLVRDTPGWDRNSALIHAALLCFSLCMCTVVGHLEPSIFILPVGLFSLGATTCILPYRSWLHVIWHAMAIAAASTYYSVLWQHLT